MPVMVELYSVDQRDEGQEKELVLESHVVRPGEIREVSLADTCVVYKGVDETHVRVLHVIIGDATLFCSSHPIEVVEGLEDAALVVGKLSDSDTREGRSAIMLCDGHLTYAQDPPQPGHTVRLRSHFVAPKAGELIFG